MKFLLRNIFSLGKFIFQRHVIRSGNRAGLHQLLSCNISAVRPALHVALAVSLAGHLIHPENKQHAGPTQFAACALLLLRDTGGGGVDVGSASVTLDDLRSSCLKTECGWSRPGTAEWARVLQDIHISFARKECAGQAQGAGVGIIELAMVVGASKFMHTIFAPPPPAAQFINYTVRIARSC